MNGIDIFFIVLSALVIVYALIGFIEAIKAKKEMEERRIEFKKSKERVEKRLGIK